MTFTEIFKNRVVMVELYDHCQIDMDDPSIFMLRVYGRIIDESKRFLTLSLVEGYASEKPDEIREEFSQVFKIIKSAIHKIVGFIPINPLSPEGIEIYGGKVEDLDPELQKMLLYNFQDEEDL